MLYYFIEPFCSIVGRDFHSVFRAFITEWALGVYGRVRVLIKLACILTECMHPQPFNYSGPDSKLDMVRNISTIEINGVLKTYSETSI